MGLSTDAEWAKTFPGSATAQRLNQSPAQPRPAAIASTTNKPAGYSLETDPAVRPAAPQPGEMKAFQTPFGRVAVGGAPRVAANVASLPSAAIPANPTPAAASAPASSSGNPDWAKLDAEDRAYNKSLQPGIGSKVAGAVGQVASTVGNAVTSAANTAKQVGSEIAAPAAPLIEGANGLARGVEATRPLWGPIAGAIGSALTPQIVSAGKAGGALWSALPGRAKTGLAQIPKAAAVTALPDPIGPLWSLGQARKMATPVAQPPAAAVASQPPAAAPVPAKQQPSERRIDVLLRKVGRRRNAQANAGTHAAFQPTY